MIPNFRTIKRDADWTVQVFYVTNEEQGELFDDWSGFEEPFNEPTYQSMADWCYNNFKTWLKPKRARRMSYNEFWFRTKKDADWFVLFWSGVDISTD